MPFEKGNEGRPKGSVNKITQEARSLFLQTIESQMPHLDDAFEAVRLENPAEYLKIVEKYAQYFIAKKVDITSKDNQLNASLTQITDDQLAQSIARLEQGTDVASPEGGAVEA
tara:strand:- start:22250 stop:22588 length:339 start_codon:yes stop_codon:yes gene_type:complete